MTKYKGIQKDDLQVLWQVEHQKRQLALEKLADPDVEIKIGAIKFLADTMDPQLGPTLLPLLQDSDARVFASTADALSRLRAFDCLPTLIKQYLSRIESDEKLDDELWMTSYFRSFNSRRWLEHFPKTNYLCADSDAGNYLTQEQLDQWLPYLNQDQESADLRYNLVKYIAPLVLKKDPVRFLKYLKDPDPDVRYQAIQLCKTIHGEGLIKSWDVFWNLYPLLSDPKVEIRLDVLRWLGPILANPSDYFQDHSPNPEELANLSGEEYYYWNFEQFRYRDFMSNLLKDCNYNVRLEALEYVIPWNTEMAREALQGLYISQDKTIRLSDQLVERFALWPIELHPLLKVLITPTHPVADLAPLLDAVRISRSQWHELLREWFDYPLDTAHASAIMVYEKGELAMEFQLIYRMIANPSDAVQKAILSYVLNSKFLSEEDRIYFLRLFTQPHETIVDALMKAQFGDDLSLMAGYLEYELKNNSELDACIQVECDYLVKQDAQMQTLSQESWQSLFTYVPIQQALGNYKKMISVNLARAMLQTLQTESEQLRQSSETAEQYWPKVLSVLPAEELFWQAADYNKLFVEASSVVRQSLWKNLKRVFYDLPDQDKLLDLAVLELQDPDFKIRCSAIEIIGLGQRPAHFQILLDLLDYPSYMEIMTTLNVLEQWGAKDAAAKLFELLHHDSMSVQIKVAKLLAKWEMVGSQSKWFEQAKHKPNPYPIALWPLLGYRPDFKFAQDFIQSESLKEVIFGFDY